MHPAMWMSNSLDKRYPNLNAWFLSHHNHFQNRAADVMVKTIAAASVIVGIWVPLVFAGIGVSPASIAFYLPFVLFLLIAVFAVLKYRKDRSKEPPWRRELTPQVVQAMQVSAILVMSGQITATDAEERAPLLDAAAHEALRAEELLKTPFWKAQGLKPVGIRAMDAIDHAMARILILTHEPMSDISEMTALVEEMRATVRELEEASGRLEVLGESANDNLRSVRMELLQLGEAHRELSTFENENVDSRLG